jgi:hypothetical protein
METSHRVQSVLVGAAFFLGGLLLASAAGAAAPICDGQFHFVQVEGARCLDGTPTGFEYACLTGSAASPLLVAIEGGGACWDGVGCDCQPDANGLCAPDSSATIVSNHFDRTQSNDEVHWTHTFFGQPGFFAGETSPFNGRWNLVNIPYCTGDAHVGHAVNTYVTSGGESIVAHHLGYGNVTRFLSVIKSLFPNASRPLCQDE